MGVISFFEAQAGGRMPAEFHPMVVAGFSLLSVVWSSCRTLYQALGEALIEQDPAGNMVGSFGKPWRIPEK